MDDHPVFRSGLVELLKTRWPRCDFVECGSAAQARAHLSMGSWSLVVLDQYLPDAFGIDLLESSWASRALLLTMQNDSGLMATTRSRGGGGYLCKSEAPKRIVQAADCIASGGRYFLAPDPATPTLSVRERAVLKALLAGTGPQAIARDLGLSRSSVQSYKERLFEKLQVTSLIELGRKASTLGPL